MEVGAWNLEFGIWNTEFGIWSLKEVVELRSKFGILNSILSLEV